MQNGQNAVVETVGPPRVRGVPEYIVSGDVETRFQVKPIAQDQRDAMLARQLNRFSRGVESVDWNTKLLVAMLRYQIELDLSFLPEPVTDEERKTVTEKGARRFDRFEQWLMRQLADPENLYGRLQAGVEPLESKHFGEPDPS